MSSVDPLDQLRKLAALKADRIIDEAEFNRLKAQLLSQASGHSTGTVPDAVDARTESVTAIPLSFESARDGHLITPQQMAELSQRLADAEAQHRRAVVECENYSRQLRKLQRKLKYFTFLLRCRKPLKDIVLGPIGPILIFPAVGILAGAMLTGLVTSSTSTMLECGLLVGVMCFAFALNAFVFPASEHLQSRSETLRRDIWQVELQRNQAEPQVIRCKALVDKLNADYQALLVQFHSQRITPTSSGSRKN